MKTWNVLHMFCGLGGGALGFQRARAERLGVEGRFHTLLGVDVDDEACRDFVSLTGAPSLCADVATLSPERLREATGGIAPDVVFTSPPCKGFSGLLSNARSREPKYEALNRLVYQGLGVVLGAWPDSPPRLIVLENVPRIATRGAELLAQVRQLLAAHGYRTHESAHDCGEIGGLAQHRRRFLLVARHEAQVPTLVYHPPIQRVRAIGEVIGPMPMPDDPRGGSMHALPRLHWKTWVRLALIPAGGDWRALGTRDGTTPYNNTFRIVPWGAPSVAITGGGTPTAGGVCVADPRVDTEYRRGTYGVLRWDAPGGTVTGEAMPSTGAFSVADPRFTHADTAHRNKYRVERWDAPAGTVIGATRPGSGGMVVADPRVAGAGSRPDLFGVLGWDQPAKTISGHASVSGSNCPAAVADPRLGAPARAGTYGVTAWDATAPAVVGASDVHAGASAVADPRIPGDDDRPDPPPVIVALDGTWHRPLTTLELAALQGLPVFGADGAPLRLAGEAHGRWRERIGNAVPPPAAEAIAGELLRALLATAAGVTFALGGTDVWVDQAAPEVLAS